MQEFRAHGHADTADTADTVDADTKHASIEDGVKQ